MKKVIALFVLALFAAGIVPSAFAEETAGADGGTDAPTEDTAAETADGSAAPLRERIKEGRERIKEARENIAENRERLITAKDGLLARHEAQVAQLVEKCRQAGKTEEECRAMFEQRLENIAALAPKFREKLQQFEERRAERAGELNELKKDTILGKLEKAKNFRARAIEGTKIAAAKAKIVVAKEKYAEAKAGLEAAKLRLENAKTERICKDSPDSEDCAKSREEIRASAKEKLAKQAEMVLANLEQAKEKITASEYVSDKEEAAAAEFLDAQITKITEIKEEIENAQTKAEIIEAAKNLADAWREIKQKVNAYLWYAVNARTAGIIVKAEFLSAKLERVLERMAENGKDTAAVEPLVADFKSKVDSAKKKFKSAHSLLLEVRTKELTEEEKTAKVEEAKSLMEEAKAALKDANEALRQIFLKLKDANAIAELAAATEAEDVEIEAETNAAEASA
ncbi:MAG TPA: hypothetical protein HA362_07435 [Nanoarchaeota archaeon]|nr:hypothetical protein [Nanoarchaeota archaeon]